jgi:hypothetical protein
VARPQQRLDAFAKVIEGPYAMTLLKTIRLIA